MARKRKTLPKDFEALLKKGDLATLQAVFDACDLNARGGPCKRTALTFDDCPDTLARWLVAQGADLNATDDWGNTPLHVRSGSARGRIDVLLELGADVNSLKASIGTPLHAAAESKNVENAAKLLAKGASVNAKNSEGLTPLELALQGCTNIELERMAKLARVLLDAGAARTPSMQEFVTEIGKRFEFHRAGFAKEYVQAASEGVADLYRLFGVVPVSPRTVHDCKSPITVISKGWQKQHAELWNLLVPSAGPAATVQGEAIRLAGRIAREIEDNGGANWDGDFRAMLRALLEHLQSGTPLEEPELAKLRPLVEQMLKRGEGDTYPLAELAVTWVLRNPVPRPLQKPAYKR